MPRERSALEFATAGGPVTAPTMARAIEEVFDGSIAARHFSFEDRCRFMAMEFLLPQRSAGDVALSRGRPGWDDGPRQRVAKSVGNFPPPVERPQAAIRRPDHLRTESSWRVQLLSVSGSWKALVSALRTFSLFCQSTQPHTPSTRCHVTTNTHL